MLKKEKPKTVRVKNEQKNEEKVFELIRRNKSFCITILLARKYPACTGNSLANICKRAQVGLLGLVPMLPQQSVCDLLLQLCLQLTTLNLAVSDHFC